MEDQQKLQDQLDKLNNLSIDHGKEYRKILIAFASGYFIVWLNLNKYMPQTARYQSIKYFLITALLYLAWEIIQMICVSVTQIITICLVQKNVRTIMIIFSIFWVLSLIVTIYFGWKSISSLIFGLKQELFI